MFARISYTWSLMGASWDVLKKDKELLVFPLVSGICCLIVMASFAVPLFLTDRWQPPDQQAAPADHVIYYLIMFVFYFCMYFVITLFNAAIIGCAVYRMEGGDPTLADGFRIAFSRLPLIAGWALVSATVGLILRIIEDRSEKVGAFVAGLLGMAWSLVSFLVVPVLVVERKGPIAALKESTVLLKRTWGEQVVGGFSFGVIFFLLGIPAWLLIAVGVYAGLAMGNILILVLCVGAGGLYLVALGLVESALHAIFQAALYLYARDHRAPAGFSSDLLEGAMQPKR